MTATTYETQTAAVVAGTATIAAGESITEAIVLDSKQNLILMVPADFTSGSYLTGSGTLLTFQVQAFAGGDFVDAADADGNLLSVNVGPGNLAPCPSEIAGAYAIKVRSGTLTGPVIQEAERAIQFVASSPASAVDPSSVTVTAQPGAANVAFSQVTTGASGAAVAARATRRYVTFKNQDSTDAIYIGTGTVTSSNSLTLLAGESVTLNTAAAINCLAAANTPVLAVVEVYD